MSSSTSNSSSHKSHGKMPAVEPRSVALRHVLKDPARNWRRAPAVLRRDKAFVLAVIEQATRLPPKSDFERGWEQWLRFDREVVLAFCRRPDFEELYHDRHLFVPGCLTDDKDVMMAYCSKIPRQLQECSEEVCDDEEVVLTAVRRSGLELQYASLRLQHDETVVRAACRSDGRALPLCCPPGATRDRLLSDREFLFAVIRHGGAAAFRLVRDPALRQDRELVLAAVQHGLELRHAPRPFRSDPDFVAAACARHAALYLELPPELQRDACIARAAVLSPASTAAVMDRVAACAPLVLEEEPGDVRVAQVVADRGSDARLRAYLQRHPQCYGEKSVMLRAVERDRGGSVYHRCAPELRRDVDVVLAAVGEQSAAAVLRSVPIEFVREHPAVAVRAVATAGAAPLRSLKSCIPADLWRGHRELQKAWLKRGGEVLPALEPAVRADRELALLVAQHNFGEFGKVGDALRGDRDFMIEAVSRDGRVLKFAPAARRVDWELVVRAVATNRDALDQARHRLRPRVDAPALKRHCRERLAAHDAFCGEILRGIAVGGPGCSLAKLDRGCETGTALKRNIGAFLGVPFGSLLKAYRQCLANLVNPPAAAPAAAAAAAAAPQPLGRQPATPQQRHARFIRDAVRAHAWDPEQRLGAAPQAAVPAAAARPEPRALDAHLALAADADVGGLGGLFQQDRRRLQLQLQRQHQMAARNRAALNAMQAAAVEQQRLRDAVRGPPAAAMPAPAVPAAAQPGPQRADDDQVGDGAEPVPFGLDRNPPQPAVLGRRRREDELEAARPAARARPEAEAAVAASDNGDNPDGGPLLDPQGPRPLLFGAPPPADDDDDDLGEQVGFRMGL